VTTIYDSRAARTLAKAEAAKAHAEAKRLQAQIDREHAEAQAERARVEREQRRRERQQSWSRWRAALPDHGLATLWAAVIIAPLLLAWSAQAAFARETLHIPSSVAWLFPLAIEAGAWVCAFEAHRRASRGAPVGALPRWMWALAGTAAMINLAHGAADFGVVAGLALAVLSVLGVLLHHIRQNLNAAEAAGATNREVWQSWMRWVLFPRTSLSALRIGVRAGSDPSAAWRAAWLDRYGVGPDSSKRDRRLGKVIVARQLAADRKAAKKGELVILNGVILRAALPAPNPPTEAPAANLSTPIEQGKRSARANALLEQALAAVRAGELPEKPSASAIRKHFGGAMETAQEVRDALAHMQSVANEEAA
jgi:hypothetical protein